MSAVFENRLPHRLELRLAQGKPMVSRAVAFKTAVNNAAEASTYGWDTAFVIRLKDVNEAISKYAVSPAGFEYTPTDRSCSVKASFGTWQLCQGGDGGEVHFNIPVPSGSLVWQGNTYPIVQATATIEVKLHYLPHTDPALTGNPQKLVISTTAAGPDEPIVSVLNLAFAGQTPDFIPCALIKASLQAWLNLHLDTFNHIFSVVDLNRVVNQDQFKWLVPTYTAYAYRDGIDEEDSCLAVLSMTMGNSAAGLAEQVSANAIPDDSRSGFLISKERLYAQMILPALPHVFPGSASADFAVTDDKAAIVNLQPINTKTVENAGTTYQPVVQKLRINLIGEELQIYTLTRVDVGLGAYAMIENTSFQRLKLATSANGTQTLTWENSRPAITDHWSEVDGGSSIIIDIIALIVMAILAILTDGAALIVALLIVALIVGLMQAIPKTIASVVAKEVSDDSPSLSLLSLNATDPIRWPGGDKFKLNYVSLNGALQLGGNPGFV